MAQCRNACSPILFQREWATCGQGRDLRLKAPILGIELNGSLRPPVQVPEGETVIVGQKRDDPRMIEVVWNDKTILMFAEDAENRGETLDGELSRINLELTAAREAYERAKVSFHVASDLHVDLDAANPDGIAALRNARVSLQAAWELYQEALLAFAKYRGSR